MISSQSTPDSKKAPSQYQARPMTNLLEALAPSAATAASISTGTVSRIRTKVTSNTD